MKQKNKKSRRRDEETMEGAGEWRDGDGDGEMDLQWSAMTNEEKKEEKKRKEAKSARMSMEEPWLLSVEGKSQRRYSSEIGRAHV